MSDVAAGRMDKVVGHIPRELPGTFFTEGTDQQTSKLTCKIE